MIRQLTHADLDSLAPLFTAYLHFYRVEQTSKRQRDYLDERLASNDSATFGAFDESGTMTGFALCHLTHNSLRLAPAWILHDLFVSTDHRRQGIARKLLTTVHAAARTAGACEVVLSTAHDNRNAQALYESAGYKRDEQFLTYVRTLK